MNWRSEKRRLRLMVKQEENGTVTHSSSFQLLGWVITADHDIVDEIALRRLVL
jgi:hypothetical protein